MRQRGDHEHISVLNKIRVGVVDNAVEKFIKICSKR